MAYYGAVQAHHASGSGPGVEHHAAEQVGVAIGLDDEEVGLSNLESVVRAENQLGQAHLNVHGGQQDVLPAVGPNHATPSAQAIAVDGVGRAVAGPRSANAGARGIAVNSLQQVEREVLSALGEVSNIAELRANLARETHKEDALCTRDGPATPA